MPPTDSSEQNADKTASTAGKSSSSRNERVVEDVAELVHSDSDTNGIEDGLPSHERVQSCLAEAIEYFHANLPDEMRAHIREKWGISNKMIDSRKIGYTGDGNGVVEHLQAEGCHPRTIIRASLGTPLLLKHAFECGVSESNAHLVPENGDGEQAYRDSECTHTDVPERLDEFVNHRIEEGVEPEEVALGKLMAFIDAVADDGLQVYNWWDKRIVFPYRNREGEFSYLIGRATDETDDKIYSNGIVDRSADGERVLTVAETELERKVPLDEDVLEEFVVLPYYRSRFMQPEDNEYQDAAERAANGLVAYRDGEIGRDQLEALGMVHEPRAAEFAASKDLTRVNIIDTERDGVIASPPAVGIEPGGKLSFINRTDRDAHLSIKWTPDGVWWDGGELEDVGVFDVEESGMYRYQIEIGGDADTTAADGDSGGTRVLNGVVVAYDDVYTERRNWTVESWVGEEPNFEVDQAKYLKQAIDRVWVDHDVVEEPIFGIETVHNDAPLLVTEGVTDAIMAHQHNFPCVAPATTNFKQEHYEEVSKVAEEVEQIFVVNDTEPNDAGLNGALRTAKVLENDGHTVFVGELPAPDGERKTDIADFLKTHSREEFKAVLADAIPPEEHPKYDPPRHDPTFHTRVRTESAAAGESTEARSRASSEPVAESDLESENVSAMYSLTLEDVIDWDSLDTRGGRTGSTVYRGANPIQHHGDSTGYFVIRDHGEFVTAKDYKIEGRGDGYYYNPLTWLATVAPCDCEGDCRCRSVRRPMGGLSPAEVFWAWKYAKEADHIPVPDDDPIPLKAVWWVANEHDLLKEEYIPESFEEEPLPDSVYNRALDTVKSEYGLRPGREKRE